MLDVRPLFDAPSDRRLFVDRERELERIAATVRRGGNVAIVGRRGVGKTSLLYGATRHPELVEREPRVVPSSAADSPADVLALVHDAFEGADRAAAAMRALAVEARTSVRTANALLDDLHLLLDSADAAGSERPVVLLDGLASTEVASTLFARLRDELWRLPLAWVVAVGEEHRGVLLEPPADAFFSTAIHLDPLDPPAMVEALARRLDEPAHEGRIEELLQTFRAWVSDAAVEETTNMRRWFEMARAWLEAGAAHDQSLTHPSTERSASPEAATRDLSETHGRVLAALLDDGPTHASDPALRARTGLSRGRLAQVLRDLEGAGFVESRNEPHGRGRPRRVYG